MKTPYTKAAESVLQELCLKPIVEDALGSGAPEGGVSGEVRVPADLYFTVIGLLRSLIDRETESGNDPS